MDNILATLQEFLLTSGLKLVGAIAIFIIGRWLAGVISRTTEKVLARSGTDKSLISFAKTLAYYLIFVIVIVASLQTVGVQTTSLVALIGAAGLAIGLALEGALANFAAGVMLLVFRPFRVGDRVEIAGKFGIVEELLVFSTILLTPTNKTIIVPNSQVTGDTITNYSRKGLLRLDMVFGIGYSDDLLKAKRILQEIVSRHELVAKNPAPTVAVLELADNSVNFAVQPFVNPDDYWTVHFDITEQVKLRFDAEGISIPFPQRDVHLFQAIGSN
jgi:small conductance mechanosensitive channel